MGRQHSGACINERPAFDPATAPRFDYDQRRPLSKLMQARLCELETIQFTLRTKECSAQGSGFLEIGRLAENENSNDEKD